MGLGGRIIVVILRGGIMQKEKEIAKRWFLRLEFDSALDKVFYDTLDRCEIPEGLTAENAPSLLGLGECGGIWALYFLEGLEAEYEKRGLCDRLEGAIKRVKNRIESAHKTSGTFDIGDMTWDRHFLMGREFRLGRLVFTLGTSPVDIEAKGICKGENVLQVHIPGGEPLIKEDCERSIELAKEFVAIHFPDFEYRYFTCLSWTLDTSIADLLGENSNILKFGALFEKVASGPSDNILRFVFGGGTTRATLPQIEPRNRFQRELKEAALSGRVFYDVRGVIAR